MGKTIVITGASSGFGALSARALADVGHRFYDKLRRAQDTARNDADVWGKREEAPSGGSPNPRT